MPADEHGYKTSFLSRKIANFLACGARLRTANYWYFSQFKGLKVRSTEPHHDAAMTLFSVENSNVQHCGCTRYKLTPYSLWDARSWGVVNNIFAGLVPYYVQITVVLSRIYNVATRGSRGASFWVQVGELRHVITARLAHLRFPFQFARGEAPVGSEN